MYIKTPTILYHETFAPDGKLFAGGAEAPLPHPGEGWVDTPTKFGAYEEPAKTVDDLLNAQRVNMATDEQNTRLREKLADADSLVALADKSLKDAEQSLATEKAAHSATQAKLDEAHADLRSQEARIKLLEPEAEKVPGLTAQILREQETNAHLTTKLTAAEEAVAAAKAPRARVSA